MQFPRMLVPPEHPRAHPRAASGAGPLLLPQLPLHAPRSYLCQRNRLGVLNVLPAVTVAVAATLRSGLIRARHDHDARRVVARSGGRAARTLLCASRLA